MSILTKIALSGLTVFGILAAICLVFNFAHMSRHNEEQSDQLVGWFIIGGAGCVVSIIALALSLIW